MWFRKQPRRDRRTGHTPDARSFPHAGRPVFELLEKKEMLSGDAPRVVELLADNRGLIEVVVDQDLESSTVNQSSVRFFTAGDDGLLGTADDVGVNNVEVTYTFGTRTITADARLLADTPYGVVLDGSIIRGVNGAFLDGEFNEGGPPSGDGVEGGDTEFFARTTGPTIARLNTNLGVIDIELFADETPLTVANFLRYANERMYDGVIFHRSVEGFVIQGGGFESDLPFLPIPTFDPVLNEPGISNVRGTIALAKLGNDPNSGTSQFFFNLDDNSSNLDNQNGGFTVFGEALDEESLAVIDAIAALETFDASVTSGAFTDVPVLDLDLIESTSGVLMERDVVRIDRVARLLTVSAEPFDQIGTDEVRTITRDGSDARVIVYGLDGSSLGDLDDFIRVSFGGGNRIESITLTSAPPQPIGIQVSGAASVGSITERRAGDLSFIVSSAPVDELRIRSAITGFALNGVLLADNLLLAEDIDGDNVFDDLTSVYIAQGTTTRAQFDDGLSGDALFEGGLLNLRVRGETTRADVRTGPVADGFEMRAQFD
ncbi:MAG: peptidylprolyl isomerase, partial [Planctomycetota bacterium]